MLIPLSDASRRSTRLPVITTLTIAINALAFLLELVGGEAFVQRSDRRMDPHARRG